MYICLYIYSHTCAPKDNADEREAFEDEDEPLGQRAQCSSVLATRSCLILIMTQPRYASPKPSSNYVFMLLTCIARCDVAEAMGEESSEIGDDALRRVRPAANGEATQLGEQGGGLRATARCAGAGIVGRHVRSFRIRLVWSLFLCRLG